MNDPELAKMADNLVLVARLTMAMAVRGESSGAKATPMDPTFFALVLLVKRPRPISEIGRRMHRSKPNMTAIVNKLMGEGLAERLPDRSDRRIVMVGITGKGRDFLKERKRELTGNMKANLARLGSSDLAALSSGLEGAGKAAARILSDSHGRA